jgi:hypothetical protein
VGVASPLFNIRKTFLRAWKMITESGEVDEEHVDRLETAWNLVLDGISSVDFQVRGRPDSCWPGRRPPAGRRPV